MTFYSSTLFASSHKANNIFSVLTFNTLCDFCTKKNYEPFKQRSLYISNILKKYSPELISLQEVRTGSQIKEIFTPLSNYHLVYADSFFLSYADATIAINKNKFDVLNEGSMWLGPKNGRFSLGWKMALPRIMVWAQLKDRVSKKEFIFIGSHFDNRKENMVGSAKLIQNFIKSKNLPVIFAGDTNANLDYIGYEYLLGKNLSNSFDHSKIELTSKNNKDLCYERKGDIFPDCRVDHILFSKDSFFKPKSWLIDTSRFGAQNQFPSDHRPIVASFILTD